MNQPPPTIAVRHALVVGAAEVLARPLAVALARRGATVSVAALTADRDEVTAAHSILNECWSLVREGGVVELGSAESVAAALAALEAAVGPLDCAVVFAPAGLAVLTAAGEGMRERGAGRVVFVGDDGGASRDADAEMAAAEAWASTTPLGPVYVLLMNGRRTPIEGVVDGVLSPPPEAPR